MEIVLRTEDIKKTLKVMTAAAEIDSFASLARQLGINDTTFRSSLADKINKDGENEGPPIRLKHFLDAADTMGFEVIVRSKQK